MKSKLLFFSILLSCTLAQLSFSQTSFTLKNALNINRVNELAEVTLSSGDMAKISTLALYDDANNQVAYQALASENKIIFQATINAGASKTYTLKSGTPSTAVKKTYAAVKSPSNRSDIAWENDRTAYRMYSKVLLSSEPNTANGVDLWVKKKATPIIDKMYTYANYHSEQEEGVDAYSVGGKTLGAGGNAAYVNNKLWLHNPYDKCQIVENGPLRSEFVLTYNSVEIDGDLYTKTVRITTDANGLLNKAVVKYDGKVKPMKFAAGILLHTGTKGTQFLTQKNIIGYAENKSEGTVTSPNARFYTGIYMPAMSSIKVVDNQLLIMADYTVGTEFTYYFGGGWNIFPAGEYSADQDWFDALTNFKEKELNPIIPVGDELLPSKKDVLNVGMSVNDYWIKNNSSPGNNLWARSVYNMGNIDFYKVYPDSEYLRYAFLWAENNKWGVSGGTTTKDADNHTAGQTYIDLYLLDGANDENKIKAIKTTLDNRIANNPNSDDWWWIDAMLMAMPTFSRLGNVYNDTKYYDKMYELFANIRSKLVVNSSHSSMWPQDYRNKYGVGPILQKHSEFDENIQYEGLYSKEDHLWWRDWGFQPNVPPKRDPNATGGAWTADAPKKSPNGKNIYWSRGNGWVIAAMARTLQLLPESDPHRNEYIQVLKEMAAALKPVQRADGFWNMNLADDTHYPGQETSGTALFAYGIAWGINNGFLDKETYYPTVAKAWNGLCKSAVESTGRLTRIQNVGEGPIAPSRLNANVDFGVGAFLLAASEVAKLAEGEMPTPAEASPISVVSVELQTTKRILITYSDDVDSNTAIDVNNYQISGKNVEIAGMAKRGSDKVLISLKNEIDYGKYIITINNVQNAVGSAVPADTKATLLITVPLDLTLPQTEIAITAINNQAGYPPANVMDGNLSEISRWSQEGKGQWIKFDLGEEVDIKAVDIAFYKGTERQSFFDIEISSDDKTYTSVLSGLESSGLTNELERYALDEIKKGRYVKIICNGNSDSSAGNWNSITEARIIYTSPTGLITVDINNQILVYPNPIVDNQLVVKIPETVKNEVVLTISGMDGKLLLSNKLIPENEKLVLNNLNLNAGSYLLTIEMGKEKASKIFIVK